MTTALVLGASGFVGARLVAMLERAGWKVSAPPRSCDLTTRDGADAAFCMPLGPADYVFHAAEVSGDFAWSRAHPADQLLANAEMTTSVLRAWLLRQREARLVAFSSLWAYPDRVSVAREEEYWDGPMHPDVAHFGVVKKLLGEGIRALGRQHGLHGCVLVLGTVYGPGDTSERLIPSLIRRMRANPDELEVRGDGSETRDFVFIDDEVERIIAHRDCAGLFNVASGKPTSVRQIVETLVDVMGYRGRIVYRSALGSGTASRSISIDKSVVYHASTPAPSPVTPLREGLARTVEAF